MNPYISNLNTVTPLRIIMVFPRAIDHLAKSLVWGMGNPPLSCWSNKSNIFPKQDRWIALGSLLELKSKTLDDIKHHKGLGGINLTDQEAAFLRIISLSIQRWFASCQERKVTNSPTLWNITMTRMNVPIQGYKSGTTVSSNNCLLGLKF